ncbi:MAG: alpha/beta hydrolase [Proteobacteria bacterium SG_bin5]|nr:alpha/beta hydrolase [Sphingomonas sp.]OQW42668.1 MAG: alpha/beta hydrolase [Proteobacteria bacterium SG_bin5]
MRRFWRFLAIGAGLIGIALVIAFLALRTPDTDPEAMRAKYAPAPSQFVDLGGGLTLHLRDTGPRDAPVLVLLHGSNASLHTWEPWAERLQGVYRVIRFDFPGHGLTGPSPIHAYGPRAYADVLERLRLKLKLGKFVLAGNSMGGSVAWHYALWHPERVRALILVDASGQPEPKGATPPFAFRVGRTPGLRDIAAEITPRSLIADSLPGAFYDHRLATPAMIDRYWELLRYPGNRAATLERFATAPDPATPARLHALAMPVLILWGANDALIPASSAAWFARHIPDAKAIVYPKTGHIPMEERADQSAADVAAFLRERLGLPASTTPGRSAR